MYDFISVIAKDLFILMCIPLVSETGIYLLSKIRKSQFGSDILIEIPLL